jgi:DnaJ-class molecular chaperone
VMVVKGEGMPRKGGRGRGDLLVTLLIQFPRDFSPKQKELLRQAIAMH